MSVIGCCFVSLLIGKERKGKDACLIFLIVIRLLYSTSSACSYVTSQALKIKRKPFLKTLGRHHLDVFQRLVIISRCFYKIGTK